jgi:Zn-dependent peptidase ImmA (M78 family)/DNA-binding XRE family transcriptional regulator
MSTSQEAFITPGIVRWARERTGTSLEKLANKINVKATNLEAWEEGEKRPTFRQAENLARTLSIPLGYLFLSEPPDTTIALPDLRTVAGHVTRDASPEFIDQFYDIVLKQQWYRAYLEEEHENALPFVRSYTLDSSVFTVAADIAEKLMLDDGLREESVSFADFLRRIIQNAESIGVLVFRSGVAAANNRRKLSVDEFRGFAISDDLAPAVFINSRDAQSAQIFTCIHELAHVWIGASGISNTVFTEKSDEQINRTERFCNSIAAQVLIPEARFLAAWQQQSPIERNVAELSAYFKVSGLVVLRQAYDHEMLTESDPRPCR